MSEIRPGSWARAWNSWGRSARLDFQALFLEVIPKALAAPMVVALWAHLLEVADIFFFAFLHLYTPYAPGPHNKANLCCTTL